MPPVLNPICRFAAEPPQHDLPAGPWAETLQAEFLAACLRVEGDQQAIGEPGELVYHPDRTWAGRTYVPVTARTSAGAEFYGFVSFLPADPEDEGAPSDFAAWADYADETADDHPEWQIDLNEAVIGEWRGERGLAAAMTLVWGRRLQPRGSLVTAELGDVTVDQCRVVQERFSLIAPDAYAGDYLEVALYDGEGAEVARESLYEDD